MTFKEFSESIERAFIPVNGERDKIAFMFLACDTNLYESIAAVNGTQEELANMIALKMCENQFFADSVEAAWSTYTLWKQTQSRSN